MMKKRWYSLIVLVFLASCTQRYFVVRHAEKQNDGQPDPSLSEKGRSRAQQLAQTLQSEKIAYIFSTNTQRTKGTAAPLSEALHIDIRTYGPIPDSAFLNRLKSLRKNVLIVGHSNTVDDIVNGLLGAHMIGDLSDSEYDHLFVVTRKGKHYSFKDQILPVR